MTKQLRATLALCALLLAPAPKAWAQDVPPVRSLVPAEKRARDAVVPASHMPPAGMCRVWIDNVPPAQQPAPTDCPTAIRNRPPNARVVFSDDDPRGRRGAKGERDRGGDELDGEREKGEKRDRRAGKRKKP